MTVFHCCQGHLVERGIPLQARIVDENIDGTELRIIRANIAATSSSDETSALHGYAFAPAFSDFLHHSLGRGIAIDVIDDDVGTSLANAIATPSPMPELAPVTSAFCPVSSLWTATGGAVDWAGEFSVDVVNAVPPVDEFENCSLRRTPEPEPRVRRGAPAPLSGRPCGMRSPGW